MLRSKLNHISSPFWRSVWADRSKCSSFCSCIITFLDIKHEGIWKLWRNYKKLPLYFLNLFTFLNLIAHLLPWTYKKLKRPLVADAVSFSFSSQLSLAGKAVFDVQLEQTVGSRLGCSLFSVSLCSSLWMKFRRQPASVCLYFGLLYRANEPYTLHLDNLICSLK